MKKILSLMGMALLMASCTDDYKDWAEPFSNAPEDPYSISFTASPASPIDFATISGDKVLLFNSTIEGPEGAAATEYEVVLSDESGENQTPVEVDAEGYANVEELEAAVYGLYGRRPVARTIPMEVGVAINVKGASIVKTASTTLTATPNAPVIEEAYYITGTPNSWNNSDTSLELTNGGGDVYENPVFKVLIPATGSDIEFKVTPKSGLGGDWSKCLTASDTEGKFATDNAGGNFKITHVEGAKFYRLEFNMLDQTWKYEALNFGEYFYEIGNESGWGTSHALFGGAGDGKYQGYYYLDGEFKFKPNADNWDNDLEYVGGDSMGGTLQSTGGPNCPDPSAGFYQINLDAGAMNYSLTKVDVISIIGDFNGWGADVDMTYNKEAGCWEATAEVNANGFKFRMNHDWAISWGGANGDGKLYDNLTQNNGANIVVDAAGTYKFQLYLSCEGKNKVVITKQ
ncbi:protein of unknown function [Xylanibacter ruminicola]|jgi:hypothetical protein|uniref:Outer membrane protein SusF N-terminal domain-containing protein n=1 Tax=Xylanibacter ruminicola TaxID=839 RepID=A0A1M7KRP8_XYLRU|nr:DUF5115 domain-containing protein [Xylanibacter ruminicola]SHM68135.1 protein of unknown function [Xylanibacter ruminicola]